MAKEFLTSVTVGEALALIGKNTYSVGTEKVPLDAASGRIAAEDVFSHEAIPAFPRSLVDGYAVTAKDTQGARETSPAFLKLSGEIRIGEVATLSVADGSCIRLSTGSMVPQGADSVVMQEYVRVMDGEVEITRPVHRGENVVYAGEDIAEGTIIIKRGTRIGPFNSGALAAVGSANVTVFARPRIALLSSGDEIVGVEEKPPFGMVRDINRYTVGALVKSAGAESDFAGIARDTIEDITSKLNAASAYDVILISGGSSKGERDHIIDSIEAQGGVIIFHGVNVKPGKPIIFGTIFGKPVFGLPGHPVSCAMATVRFVLPLIKLMTHDRSLPAALLTGRLLNNVPSSYGIEEYVRVKVSEESGECLVTPIFAKSAVISSLSEADGYIIVPEGAEGFEKNEYVKVHRFF
ncbi:MAG: molybdopterin molybdotransferase MoeA [Syntrophorhabdaceae bacterium]